MNKNLLLLIVVSVFTSASSIPVQAQSSNSDSIVIYVVPDTEEGWSAKKTFLGKAVYNESKQKVGTITDLLVAPDTSVHLWL